MQLFFGLSTTFSSQAFLLAASLWSLPGFFFSGIPSPQIFLVSSRLFPLRHSFLLLLFGLSLDFPSQAFLLAASLWSLPRFSFSGIPSPQIFLVSSRLFPLRHSFSSNFLGLSPAFPSQAFLLTASLWSLPGFSLSGIPSYCFSLVSSRLFPLRHSFSSNSSKRPAKIQFINSHSKKRRPNPKFELSLRPMKRPVIQSPLK